MGGRVSGRTFASRALLLRSVPYGERDAVATFFTEEAGVVGALLRGARSGARQGASAMAPFHELAVTLVDRGRDLCQFREGSVARLRPRLTASWGAMEAGGRLLRVARALAPERVPEPALWGALCEALDALDAAEGEGSLEGLAGELVRARLLAVAGYALRTDACARCETARPEGRGAYVSVAAGGVLCASCTRGEGTIVPSALLGLLGAAQGPAPLARLLPLAAEEGAARLAAPLARLLDAAQAHATGQLPGKEVRG